ncbi:MAG: type II toxin-antitoxin system VapC family toxin [Okeania sp. SIO3B3]|nr:type II toxin-antitoxin system VapC family toxin [Okeania sp. SIO3B3]
MSNNSLIYLLDTNVCIMYLKGKVLNIKNRIDNLEAEKIAVCSVVKAELFYGSMRSNNPQKNFNLQKSFVSQFEGLQEKLSQQKVIIVFLGYLEFQFLAISEQIQAPGIASAVAWILIVRLFHQW